VPERENGQVGAPRVNASIAAARVKSLAVEVGFDLAAISRADVLAPERQVYQCWIEDGRQGEMRWITPEYVERSSDPRAMLPGARSVLSVALRYRYGSRPPRPAGSGTVARYAWGRDYHAVLGERLDRLAAQLREEFGEEYRWFVDAGPAMDKALARRAGIGWYGKNTNVLTRAYGSWVLLGEIVTTLGLTPDEPIQADCGTCSLCAAACPTEALHPDYSIDARACISYLTIEHRGPIPSIYRAKMGAWVFGCDICQDVCPPSTEPYLHSRVERLRWAGEVRTVLRGELPTSPGKPTIPPDMVSGPLYEDGIRPYLDLVWLLQLSHEEYLEAFRGTAIRRAKVWMLRRNAAIALGNVGMSDALPPLLEAVQHDDHPLVRGHAAWAVGRLVERGVPAGEAQSTLLSALQSEDDPSVHNEIVPVLTMLQRATSRPMPVRLNGDTESRNAPP
jgi:epoxyqueuosine reductase